MDIAEKRFVLRMIPYGVHVVTARDEAGAPVATTAHWVTQTSFAPALVMVALPTEGLAYAAIRATNRFALHMLGKDDAGEAFAFQTRPAVLEGDTLSGWGFAPSRHSALPLLHDAVGVLECTLRAVIEYGDHHPFIAEVSEAHLRLPQQDRPDQMILHMSEMGRTIFYAG
jgi:flavin reductase (DIM6/NTAB) family NADH-FMN oxidoreductase RutF